MSRLGDRVRRFLQRPGTADLGPCRRLVEAAGAYEDRFRSLTDDDLADVAARLRRRAGQWDDGDRAEACALGREAADRALGERPFDVQLLGLLGMLSGYVVEMATGEGKTLAGALAAAAYALQGRSVHVVSVNDYLARRDAQWMAPLYDTLGVSVGWLDQTSTRAQRRAAYAAEVTYAPVSEIGFDVLRDRLCTDPGDLVVPAPDVALVDEADSVLIDEARVPLVLAGATAAGGADPVMASLVRSLRPGTHYEVDDDGRTVHLTGTGSTAVETSLDGINLYSPEHLPTLTAVNVALHAHALLRRDVDYVVRDGKVYLVNESRGRIALLQRWPDGLQAAVEVKEGLPTSESGEVLDSVTVQALIGRYPTVCGMTGTAVGVAEQLREFYGLEVGVVPPNLPCVRVDEPDRLYATVPDKVSAIVTEVAAAHAVGRPVLIGTASVAESERLARRLRRARLSCVVLNAKDDAREAAIVAEAGAYGAITVSTQMAGRGTDIRLGGADGTNDRDRVVAAGGLYVIGTGRYWTGRLDDQLRGRSGRQGDPGRSVFFTSPQDDLVAQYAPEAAGRVGADDDGRVRDRRSGAVVEHAQRVAEGANLELHRTTWRYTRLTEQQRRVVLDYRDRVLHTDRALGELGERCPKRCSELRTRVDESALVRAARLITLYHLDRCWAEHLAFLADLREGIHLRALGKGINPLDEFHREAIGVFRGLLDDARSRSADTFQTVEITADGVDLAGAGLQRPTATWTYLVNDNPFGTEAERVLKRLGSAVRGTRRS